MTTLAAPQGGPLTAAAPREHHPMAGHMPAAGLSADPYAHARPVRPTPETGAQIDRCARALAGIWDAAAAVASELADAAEATGIPATGDGITLHRAGADSAPAAYDDHGTLIVLDAPPLRGYDRAVAKRIARLAARAEALAEDLAADAARRHCPACAAAAAEGSYHAAHAR